MLQKLVALLEVYEPTDHLTTSTIKRGYCFPQLMPGAKQWTRRVVISMTLIEIWPGIKKGETVDLNLSSHILTFSTYDSLSTR